MFYIRRRSLARPGAANYPPGATRIVAGSVPGRRGQCNVALERMANALRSVLSAALLSALAACGADSGSAPPVEQASMQKTLARVLFGPGETALHPLAANATGQERGDLGADKAIDGDPDTRWSSAFEDTQALTLDFGKVVSISRVTIAWENAHAAQYALQTSDDGLTWTTIRQVLDSIGGNEELAQLSGSGRYLRVKGMRRSSPYGYSIFEIEAFGAGALLSPVNASASASERNDVGPANAVDGQMNTRWSSGFSDDQWLVLDYGTGATVNRVKIDWENAYGKDYDLQTSDDLLAWTTIKSVTDGGGGSEDWTGLNGSGRYLRVKGVRRSSPYGYSIFEITAWGSQTSQSVPPTVPGDPANPAPPATPSPEPGSPPPVPVPEPEPVPEPALPPSAVYQPLSWPGPLPAAQYTLSDGTLVTNIGGRGRERHAREMMFDAKYGSFPSNYFERRTNEFTIYENVSPKNPAHRILTIVMKPQWWLFGTNFRAGYIGRRGEDPLLPVAKALYANNGGMKMLPGGVITRTPLSNYDQLKEEVSQNYATDPNIYPKAGEFVLVKQIDTASQFDPQRPLRDGDLVEFEASFFLAGDRDVLQGQAYYADAYVYQVGRTGLRPWYRGKDTNVQRPWEPVVFMPEALSGGQMTVQEDTSDDPNKMLMQTGTNTAGYNIQKWIEGRRVFHTSMISGNHSEENNTKLATMVGKTGAHFSQTRCVDCHSGNGKSAPAPLNQPLTTFTVFTGTADPSGKLAPDPRFGSVLQQGTLTVNGKVFDGRQGALSIASYEERKGTYPDGTVFTLQKPVYRLTDKAGKILPLPEKLSVRAAPHVTGMGMLEAVTEQYLEGLVKAQKNDPDGVAGKLQIVRDPADPTISRVGRFGWRAGSPTIEAQTALAFNDDMGVTSPLKPKQQCESGNKACAAPDTRGVQLSSGDVATVAQYLSLTGIPPRRHMPGVTKKNVPWIIEDKTIDVARNAQMDAAEATRQARVANGAKLFDQARCTACHAAVMQTGAHKFAELRHQVIRPYTDLLLHDMGPDLADSYAEGIATEREWRTAPLWGVGLVGQIDPRVRYLHDGRARTLEEAVLWHGGQAGAARQRFMHMAADWRKQVIEFIESL